MLSRSARIALLGGLFRLAPLARRAHTLPPAFPGGVQRMNARWRWLAASGLAVVGVGVTAHCEEYAYSPERKPINPKDFKDINVWGSHHNNLIPTQEDGSDAPFEFSVPGILTVASSTTQAAMICENGDLLRWGDGFQGSSVPKKVTSDRRIKQVACSSTAAFALTKEGAVLLLGDDKDETEVVEHIHSQGYLGLFGGVSTVRYKLKGIRAQLQFPVDLKDDRVVDIVAGEHHIIARTANGLVFAAATDEHGNEFGQLGLGHKDSVQPLVFSAVTLPERSSQVVSAACGHNHVLLLTSGGQVYAFGSNDHLQLGLGPYHQERVTVQQPTLVKHLPTETHRCTGIAAGGNNSAFIMDNESSSELFMSGFGQYGQLGNGTFTHMQGEPTKTREISDRIYYDDKLKKRMPIRIKHVSIGTHHVAAVLDTQYHEDIDLRALDVYTWGYNKDGQLGDGTKVASPVPKPPKSLLPYDTMSMCLCYGLQIVQRIHCGDDLTIVYKRSFKEDAAKK